MLEKILHYCMSGKKFFSKGLGKNSNLNQPPSKSNGRLQKNELEIVGLYILLLDFFFHTEFKKVSSGLQLSPRSQNQLRPENHRHSECITRLQSLPLVINKIRITRFKLD